MCIRDSGCTVNIIFCHLYRGSWCKDKGVDTRGPCGCHISPYFCRMGPTHVAERRLFIDLWDGICLEEGRAAVNAMVAEVRKLRTGKEGLLVIEDEPPSNAAAGSQTELVAKATPNRWHASPAAWPKLTNASSWAKPTGTTWKRPGGHPKHAPTAPGTPNYWSAILSKPAGACGPVSGQKPSERS